MKVVHCSRCGIFLSQSELRYIVGVHVTLDLDGCGGDGAAERLAHRMYEGDESLTELYSREMAFTLCPACRDRFVANPLDHPEEQVLHDHGLLQ